MNTESTPCRNCNAPREQHKEFYYGLACPGQTELIDELATLERITIARRTSYPKISLITHLCGPAT